MATSFREKLRYAMAQKRMTNRELGDAIGTYPERISKWFGDKGLPDLHQAYRIAKALEVPIEWLADEEADSLPVSQPSGLSLPEDEAAILLLYQSLRRAGAIDMDRAIAGISAMSGLPVPIRRQVNMFDANKAASDDEDRGLQPGDSITYGEAIFTMVDEMPTIRSQWGDHVFGKLHSPATTYRVFGECELFDPDETSAVEILNRLDPWTGVSIDQLGPFIEASKEFNVQRPGVAGRWIPHGRYQVIYRGKLRDSPGQQLFIDPYGD